MKKRREEAEIVRGVGEKREKERERVVDGNTEREFNFPQKLRYDELSYGNFSVVSGSNNDASVVVVEMVLRSNTSRTILEH